MTLFEWLFDIIRPVDVLEIALVAFILYRLYRLMRGTIAVQIALGLLALFVVQVVVAALDMTILTAFFSSLSGVFVIAIIVLFQPELRRLLLLLGQNPLIRNLMRPQAAYDVLDEVVAAAVEMSALHMGALIAFERTTGLRSYAETGTLLRANLDHELLVTIFYGKNPLHDGAVIVRNGLIEAARCILPVTQRIDLDAQLGLRHRAAIGLSEQTDAFVIVVSEETGQISVAWNGELLRNLTGESLGAYLSEALGIERADDRPELVSENV